MNKIKLCLLYCCLIWSSISNAAPKKDLWLLWQANNPLSTLTVDNTRYQNFLNKYVSTNNDGVNLVSYSQVTPEDKQNLESYLTYLSTIKISQYNRNEQLAYWANLYNALTIDTILKHMPVSSILKIKLGGLFSIGPWDGKLITVENQQLSLNDIEHRIIRPIWNDSRTHYILNCASFSCPNIQNIPFSGKIINQTLDNAAGAYVNSSRAIMIMDNKLVVSQIYDWYGSDFGSNDAQIINQISKYAKPELKTQLQKFNKINSYDYNWSLNGK